MSVSKILYWLAIGIVVVSACVIHETRDTLIYILRCGLNGMAVGLAYWAGVERAGLLP